MKFYLIRAKILAILIRLFGWLLNVELPPIPSVAAIIVRNDKLLVVRLSYRNGLALPGGIMKKGETDEQGLCREVKEETGLKVIKTEYLGSFFGGIELSGINCTFIVEVTGQIKNSNEGEVLWVDPKQALRKFVYEDNIQAVRKYFGIK